MIPCQCSSGLLPKAASRSCVPRFPSCVLSTSESGTGRMARAAPLATHPTNCPCMAVAESTVDFRNLVMSLPKSKQMTFLTQEPSLTLGLAIKAMRVFFGVPQALSGQMEFRSAMSKMGRISSKCLTRLSILTSPISNLYRKECTTHNLRGLRIADRERSWIRCKQKDRCLPTEARLPT